MTTCTYDRLSDLINDDLRRELRRWMRANPGPHPAITHLRNDHLVNRCGLILPELSPHACIPLRYERWTPTGLGWWGDVDLSNERTFARAIDPDSEVLVRFGRCSAIYA